MIFSHNIEIKEKLQFINIKGRLTDRYQADELIATVKENIEEGNTNLLVNLSDLEFINSTGLSILINMLTFSRQSNGDVVLYGISEKMKELLLITKLNSIFQIAENEEEAVKIFTCTENI